MSTRLNKKSDVDSIPCITIAMRMILKHILEESLQQTSRRHISSSSSYHFSMLGTQDVLQNTITSCLHKSHNNVIILIIINRSDYQKCSKILESSNPNINIFGSDSYTIVKMELSTQTRAVQLIAFNTHAHLVSKAGSVIGTKSPSPVFKWSGS